MGGVFGWLNATESSWVGQDTWLYVLTFMAPLSTLEYASLIRFLFGFCFIDNISIVLHIIYMLQLTLFVIKCFTPCPWNKPQVHHITTQPPNNDHLLTCTTGNFHCHKGGHCVEIEINVNKLYLKCKCTFWRPKYTRQWPSLWLKMLSQDIMLPSLLMEQQVTSSIVYNYTFKYLRYFLCALLLDIRCFGWECVNTVVQEIFFNIKETELFFLCIHSLVYQGGWENSWNLNAQLCLGEAV